MRRRTIGDWFFLLTFAVPLIAAVSLLGLLGLLRILDLFGANTLSSNVWPVFLATAAGFVGLVFLFRLVVLVAGAVAVILLALSRTARGATLLVKTTFRGV